MEELKKQKLDKTLINSWKDLSVYDRTASRLKKRFITNRYYVISMTLIASIAAVLANVLEQRLLTYFFAIISFVLPAISSWLINDIVKFSGTSAWIKYRYVAEMMRTEIILFRLNAGDYNKLEPHKKDNLLAKRLEQIPLTVDLHNEISSIKVPEPQTLEELFPAIRQANQTTPEDNGFNPISIDHYIEWRVNKQRNWYEKRVREEIGLFRFFSNASQAFLIAGSALGAVVGLRDVDVIILITVTNAVSVFLNAYSNITMIGKTYRLFKRTAVALKNIKADWEARENDPDRLDMNTEHRAFIKFVNDVEEILIRERKEWYLGALQTQEATDKSLLEEIKRLSSNNNSDNQTDSDQSPAIPLAPEQSASDIVVNNPNVDDNSNR
jgi:hypothetical protein